MEQRIFGFGQTVMLCDVLGSMPDAVAYIKGDGISGEVQFYQTPLGVIVAVEVRGLPKSEHRIFAFHIHEGTDCGGEKFANTKSHYNPTNTLHPNHAGDLPPLFSSDGYALSVVLTDRFEVKEIKGKTVVIHSDVDDFTSQPAGNSGEKIACGVIV